MSKKKSDIAKPFIKGYLPVRLLLGGSYSASGDPDFMLVERGDDTDVAEALDETFFYVKEHNVGNNKADTGESKNATLFVTNCPVIPYIRTKLLLQAIFGRYGEVIRVTVIPKIQSSSNHHHHISVFEVNDELCRWTTRYSMKPDLYPPIKPEEEGRFAHVVFSSTKEMKRTLRALQDIMSSSSNPKFSSTRLPGISLDPIELQTLADESDRQSRTEESLPIDDDENHHDDSMMASKSNIHIVAEHCRKSCQAYADRLELLKECNAVMEAYEDVEEAAERRKREMASLPDEDGFITVSYTADVGRTQALENRNSKEDHARRRGTKRVRSNHSKKKGMGGAQPLPDFYRFQTREHRQKSIQELRSRFEDDLQRIKKMKEEH